MKKILSTTMVLSVLTWLFPQLVLATDSGGNPGSKEEMREEIAHDNPEVQVIRCRLNRLTDIVFHGTIKKVVMSDARGDDFKIIGRRVGSENHMIVEPLKQGAVSDVFVFGVNWVRYLRVRAVPPDHPYAVRFDADRSKKVSFP